MTENEEAVRKLQMEILQALENLMNEHGLMLGGGTALMLKYNHRFSEDLDLFVWDVARSKYDKILREIWKALAGFNREERYQTIFVYKNNVKVKLELHVRKSSENKLLLAENLGGIHVLSDEDILGEKIYYGERCTERDLFDVKFLMNKHSWGQTKVINILNEKFYGRAEELLEDLRRYCPKMWKTVMAVQND